MPRSLRAPSSTLSIRLTPKERANIEQLAGNTPISTYVKSQILGREAPTRGRRRASADQILLAQLLGQLGATRLPAAMREMAQAAATGNLHVDDLTASYLRDACDDIREMHILLMTALGKKVAPDPKRAERLKTTFLLSAMNGRVL